jgi:hypothetical protein
LRVCDDLCVDGQRHDEAAGSDGQVSDRAH